MKLSAPLMVSIQVTDNCNCNCKYCYNGNRNNRYISYRDFIFLIDLFSSKNVFKVILEGGEPLLHDELFLFYDYIIKRGIDCSIITNGTLISNQIAKSFSKRSYDIILSLDSASEHIHNKTRNKFQDVLNGINNLIKYKIDFGINTVINKYNIDDCHSIIDTFYPQVKRFAFLRLIPRIENNTTIKDLDSFSKSQLNTLEKNLRLYIKKYDDIHIASQFNLSESRASDLEESLTVNGCLAGSTYLTIKPNLDVIPCSCCQNLTIGNLNKSSFESIWSSSYLQKIRIDNSIPCLKKSAVYS